MEKVDVIADLSKYAVYTAECLVEENGCKLKGIVRASEHAEDKHLYYVICEDMEGQYVSWLLNVSRKTLNHGHYGFGTHLACLKDVLSNRVREMKEELKC